MKLICLHCAGGSSGLFKNWKFKNIETIPIDLPGRGKSMNLPMLRTFNEALEFVEYQVRTQLFKNEEWILFGHSMGGYFAFELEQILQQKPSLLIMSGINFPSDPISLSIMYENNEDFIEKLFLLGGISSRAKDHHLFVDWFAPLIKRDLQILSTYEFTHSENNVDTPMILINSKDDPLIKKNTPDKWRHYNENLKYYHTMGGHFAIYRQTELIFSIIQSELIN